MGELERIIKLADMMVAMEDRVEQLEDELDDAKAELLRMETDTLPTLMQELGLKDFTLDDGSKVEMSQDVQCGISGARAPQAHKWLDDNKFGAIIKTQVITKFDRGQREEALELKQRLDNYDVTMKESVHAQTLKSFVKERMEAGDAIPFDLFGIHPFNRVKIKRAK